ncbi:MAG TPA: hypothetical protein VIY51_28120 [Xanthobacteraceae bacterium]
MHRLPHLIACLLLAADISAAAAAPQIPSSVLPGRERDRFTESPVERFMRPAPYQPPQVIAPYNLPGCDKPRHSKPRSASRKNC